MLHITFASETTLDQLVLLLVAFVLSAIVGFDRQRRLKSAGLRTHTLVGLGSALFTIVSAYGFASISGPEVSLDPSRIAAQVVSGIGFLGAGVIFVRQNVVNGLTTAASIWVTASIGMACGAGMPLVAAVATLLYVATVSVFTYLGPKIPRVDQPHSLILVYKEGRGALASIFGVARRMGYEASITETQIADTHGKVARIEALMVFRRRKNGVPIDHLVRELAEIRGLAAVRPIKDED